MLSVVVLYFSQFFISHYYRDHKIRASWLCFECCWDGDDERRNSCLDEYRYLTKHRHDYSLKGSKEGSGTAGTAAVNMAADLERCFLGVGNAAALHVLTMVDLHLGMDFQRLAYSTLQCLSKPLLVEVSIHRSPGGITLQIFFFVSPILPTYSTRKQLSLKRDKGNFLPSFWKLAQESEEKRNSP